jgi:hypothetical protein
LSCPKFARPVRHPSARGHWAQSGLRGRQISDPRSRIAQLISLAWEPWTTAFPRDCRYGSYRISASLRGPKYRSSTRAMLLSRRGSACPWPNRSIALAMYCPTPGNDSASTLVEGKILPRRTSSVPSSFIDAARRFQSPIGRRWKPNSASDVSAMTCQLGKRFRNPGRNAATAVAVVRCSSTSETICSYKDALGKRHENDRPLVVYQVSKRCRNVSTAAGVGADVNVTYNSCKDGSTLSVKSRDSYLRSISTLASLLRACITTGHKFRQPMKLVSELD